MAGKDEQIHIKAMSLGDQVSMIRRAWREQFRKPVPPMPAAPAVENAPRGWVREVYADRVIVEFGEKLFSYPYTVGEENAITFGEPEEVAVEYEPVAKSFSFLGDPSAPLAVKSLGETDEAYIIAGIGKVWGGPNQRDLSPWPNADGSRGEFFTPQTAGMDDIPVKALTFEHDMEVGPDKKPMKDILGHTLVERDLSGGRWIEAQSEKGRKYAKHVMELVRRGRLNFSSETASHWREVAADGEIKRWRTTGYTLTRQPSEPRQTEVAQVKAAYKSLGLDLPKLPNDPPDDPDGGADAGASGRAIQEAKALNDILLTQIVQLEVA